MLGLVFETHFSIIVPEFFVMIYNDKRVETSSWLTRLWIRLT